MSIRRNIILLTVPLFLVLAMVNGALLYFQERAEMAHALREEALAAALTSAEFIASMDDPRMALMEPLRARSLRRAAQSIAGLDALYLVLPGQPPHALIPPLEPLSLQGLARPEKAIILSFDADGPQPRHVVALAPSAGGAFVAARIDAEPMFARLSAIREAILAIVLVAGVLAAGLAWFVARRIVRELDENRRAIAAIGGGQTAGGDEALTIRETRDLAGAVRLMEASSRAAADRSRRVAMRQDRERTPASALAASHAAHFAAVSRRIAGAAVAARIAGGAEPGSFFALCDGGTRGMVAIGRCGGASLQAAFANARDARAFLEKEFAGSTGAACVAAATARYAIEDIRLAEWQTGESTAQLLKMSDADDAASRYAKANPDALPAELLDEIEILLAATGILAAVR